jgi:hypothetical protein
MPKSQASFALRWLLPIVQLILCVTALWPWRVTLVHQIGQSLGAYRTSSPSLSTAARRDSAVSVSAYMYADPQDMRTLQALESHEWVPLLLNLPSGLVQLPYAALNPTREDWKPRGMNLRTWRVMSWPIIGILFWWCAGRGIEALLAARRGLINPHITWPETLVAVALFLFCGITAVSLPVSGQYDRNFPLIPWVLGSGTWALLAGLTIAARVLQWRLTTQRNIPLQSLPIEHSSYSWSPK